MQKSKTNYIVKVAMLSAAATILFFIKAPIPFIAPPFYEFDLSNIASLIGSFALGPFAGVLIELIKNLLNLMIDGSITGGVGELSNFLTGCAFVLPSSIIYMKNKNKKSAIKGLLAGIVIMTAFSYFSNIYIMIPAYSKALNLPVENIVAMGTAIHKSITSMNDLVLLCVVPFNIIKGIILSVITFLLYKKIRVIL